MPLDWLYSGDPLKTDRDEVRFLCGDTDASDPLLEDAEVDGAIQMALQANAPTHISTTVSNSYVVTPYDALPLSSSTLAVNGTHAAGSDTIDLDATTLKGSVRPGDVLLIAGHAARYTVMQTVVTAADNALVDVQIWPGLIAAAADNVAAYVRLFNVKEAAALCCEALSRRFAREVDESVDGRSRQR